MTTLRKVSRPEVKAGDTVYSHRGECATVEAVLPDYIIVSEHYQDDETGQEYVGPLVKWYDWYLDPKLVEQGKINTLKDKDEQLAKLNLEIRDATNQRDNLKYEIAELDKKIGKYAPIREALLYAEQGVQWVVSTESGGIERYEITDRYSFKMYRMLSLTAKPRGFGDKVEWMLNAYKDGSGSDRGVVLCSTPEEAQAASIDITTRLVIAEAQRLQKAVDDNTNGWPTSQLADWMKRMEEWKLPLPEKLKANLATLEARTAQATIESKEKELAEARLKWEELKRTVQEESMK